MNKLFPLLVSGLLAVPALAQHSKQIPPPASGASPRSLHLQMPGSSAVPLSESHFGVAPTRRNPLSPLALQQRSAAGSVKTILGENGLPIYFEGRNPANSIAADSRPMAERALEYLDFLHPEGLQTPAAEFIVGAVQTDEQGNAHVRLQQQYQGLPVWGGELIAHSRNGVFDRLTGRYYPSPELPTTAPAIDREAALQAVKNDLGVNNIKQSWTPEERSLIAGGEPFSAELLVFHPDEALQGERLAWHIVAYPNLLDRFVYFIDARDGKVLNSFRHTCKLVADRHPANGERYDAVLNGPVDIQGQDLLGINRSFVKGGWQSGSTVYMEDTGKNMYNSGASSMPNDPVGVIVTLDGLNGSPQNSNFDYDIVKSSGTGFAGKQAAVSAHYNANASYDYYWSKFTRKSIDGVGGNILSFVNITESNGQGMDNAFWNGAAMWYGNGQTYFKPLARGLDVGGHELTHGVVEKTANLTYQGESGALNESFADVFGAMIDSDDWKIGEDVMKTGINPSNCLRDLSNPHNGVSSNSSWWQPNHVNEKDNSTDDNGGVHINSGIPNYAFYLFASNASVGKAKAEQVYYKALRDYLTKSSKFVDCRIAVIQAATDLYGASVANIAANAFSSVGIGGSAPSGNYLGQLSPNPGTDYILCVSNDLSKLEIANGSGSIVRTLYTQGLISRPSITDNGQDLVFVNANNQIVGISLDYSTNPIGISTFVNQEQDWRQAAISKDGRFIAALYKENEPYIYIFDLINGDNKAYQLYNPTYTAGQVTGDAKFADVLEFDYSGVNLMYDSYNELSNNLGEDISYWDIGFLEFWDNGQFVDPNKAFISKAFSGLPEKVGIGDPAFSKNSPYVIAFDLLDNTSANTIYDIYGANIETGDYDRILANNGTLGWPNYNRLDNKLLYETNPSSGIYNIRLQGLASNKYQASGANTAFISNHSWGVWYGNGNRSLKVDAKEPSNAGLNMAVSPNPVQGSASIQLQANAPMEMEISVCNLFGQTLLSRRFQLQEGNNRLDYDMSALPAGSYVIRAVSGANGVAVKVVR